MKTNLRLIQFAAIGFGGFLCFNQPILAQKDNANKKPDVHINIHKKMDKNGT